MAYEKNITHTAQYRDYWASQSVDVDTVKTEQLPETLGCNRLQVVHTRTTPPGIRDDVMVWSVAIAKIVGGRQYGVLDDAGRASAEASIIGLLSALDPYQSNQVTVTEFVWHEHRANHPATEHGYETIGAAVRRTPINRAGTATGPRLPDQNSCSVSLRTASRRHWGRFYLPGLAVSDVQASYGRYSSAMVDAIAAGTDAWQTALDAAGLQLGVWTWKYGAFLTCKQVRVDDVVDTQRRRRAKQVSHFSQHPL